MSLENYRNDDIVIVGRGCVLPDANSPEDFWKNLVTGHDAIRPTTRWKKEENYSPYRELEDKTYSYYGAEISKDRYKELKSKNFPSSSKPNRLEVMATEAIKQAASQLIFPKDPTRISTILGIMNPDESFYSNRSYIELKRFKDSLPDSYSEEMLIEIEKLIEKYEKEQLGDFSPDLDYTLPTSVIHNVNQALGIRGKSYFVDAACASSLASIDICMMKLQNREIDLAFAGGLESNLSPGSYVLFSKVGALAVERCLPFDEASDGLSQGEGAVIFALERMEDALRNNHKIFGIVRSCAGSSDGRSASLFQPTVAGQILAYSRAYSKLDSKIVDYVEAHGTGTKVGDFTELQSLSLFFKDYQFPIGSVKSLVGHTKATAGATSLMKLLFMMENKVVPASRYFKKALDEKSNLFVNNTDVKLKSKPTGLRFGVSSLGFGGCNYHLVVEEYVKKMKPEINSPEALKEKEPKGIAILGESFISLADFNPDYFTGKESIYRVPPKSIKDIDKCQLLAVKATAEAFRNANINLELIDKDNVMVISASSTGLPIVNNMVMRIAYDTFCEMLQKELNEIREFNEDAIKSLLDDFKKLKQKHTPVTEDSGPGVLNNVIAGRVCNAFNFKGKSFNVDCDVASISSAFDVINTEIQWEDDKKIFVMIGIHETVNAEEMNVERYGIHCVICTSVENANEQMMKIQKVIEVK